MKEITKQEFVKRITSKKSVFLGGTRQKLTDEQIIHNTEAMWTAKQNGSLIQSRKARAGSNFNITFSDDTHLSIGGNLAKVFEINENIIGVILYYEDKTVWQYMYYALESKTSK